MSAADVTLDACARSPAPGWATTTSMRSEGTVPDEVESLVIRDLLLQSLDQIGGRRRGCAAAAARARERRRSFGYGMAG